ncbi:hypothetical protein THRCLA_04442 [Thraustotheca clavata]|uniref:Uncharacterized protein n=1 Tax=Thraustotheca clavata TaxID=74557 RepID=A0A1V9ZZ90_9STRA|nr:hypothetical protein THRCLA_04442 [Thraustotheca clavata]
MLLDEKEILSETRLSIEDLKKEIGYVSPHHIQQHLNHTKHETKQIHLTIDVRCAFDKNKQPKQSCLKKSESPTKVKIVTFDAKKIFEERTRAKRYNKNTDHVVIQRRYSVEGPKSDRHIRLRTDYIVVKKSPPKQSALLRLHEDRNKQHEEWLEWSTHLKIPEFSTPKEQSQTYHSHMAPELNQGKAKLKHRDSLDDLLRPVALAKPAKKRNSMQQGFLTMGTIKSLLLLLLGATVFAQDISYSLLNKTTQLNSTFYSPTYANISINLGDNLSFNQFNATKFTLLNILADMMQVERSRIRISQLTTQNLNQSAMGSFTMEMQVDFQANWNCMSHNMLIDSITLPAYKGSIDAMNSCNAITSCNKQCQVQPSVPFNAMGQEERMRRSLEMGYSLSTQNGSAIWLAIGDIKNYFNLYPNSTLPLQLEQPTTQAPLSSAYLAINFALAGDVDGTDALPVIFTLVQTLQNVSLSIRSANIRTFPLSAIPFNVYQRQAKLLMIAIAEPSEIRRVAITNALKSTQWLSALKVQVLSFDASPDASVPTAQIPASAFWFPSLELSLACPITEQQLEDNLSSFLNGIVRALPQPMTLLTGAYDARPLFMDIIDGDQLNRTEPSTFTITLPVQPMQGMDLDKNFIMRLQLAWWSSPFFCNKFPTAIIKEPPSSTQIYYARITISLQMNDPLNPLALYRIKMAMLDILNPLNIGYDDMLLSNAISGAMQRNYTLLVYYDTIEQQTLLQNAFQSSSWPTAFAQHVGDIATLNDTQLIVPASVAFTTNSYPGIKYNSISNSRSTNKPFQRVHFVRPKQKYLYRSITMMGNCYSSCIQVSIDSGIEYNNIYLDAISFIENVTLDNNMPLDGQIAPIVYINTTSVWAMSAPGDFCLHFKQVYDTVQAEDAFVACRQATDSTFQVSIQNNQPEILDIVAPLTRSGLSLSIRDVRATFPYQFSGGGNFCSTLFLKCRTNAACREIAYCLNNLPMLSLKGALYGWSPDFFRTLSSVGIQTSINALPLFASCHDTIGTSFSTMIGWQMYMGAMICSGQSNVPLNWFDGERAATSNPNPAQSSMIVFNPIPRQTQERITISWSTYQVSLIFSIGDATWTFYNYSTSTPPGAVQAFIQTHVYYGVGSALVPYIQVSLSNMNSNGYDLLFYYSGYPPLDIPKLRIDSVNATRTIFYPGSLYLNSVPYSKNIFSTIRSPAAGCALVPIVLNFRVDPIDPLWVINDCYNFDLKSGFLSGSDYIGYLNIDTERQFQTIINTILPQSAATCLGSIPGIFINRAIEGIVNNPFCSDFYAFQWKSLLNMSNQATLQSAYANNVCPLYFSRGKQCIENVLIPSITQLFQASGDCCAGFDTLMHQNYSSNFTQLLLTGSQLMAEAFCSPVECANVSQSCVSSILSQLTTAASAPAWFSSIIQAFQLASSQGNALWAGEVVTTFSNVSFSLYNAAECTLSSCGTHFDKLFSWVATFPLWEIYSIPDDTLLHLFQSSSSACVQGTSLLQLVDSLFDLWHNLPQQWSLLQHWTDTFYSNLDYIYTTWMEGQCYHIPNGYSISNNQTSTPSNQTSTQTSTPTRTPQN